MAELAEQRDKVVEHSQHQPNQVSNPLCPLSLTHRLAVDVDVDGGLLAEGVARHARQEVTHDQLVHAGLVACS